MHMRLLFSVVLLSVVVIGSIVGGGVSSYAISDDDRIAKIQKGIDKLLERIQMIEDKKYKIENRIDTLQDKIAKKQAKIDSINGIVKEHTPPEPYIKTDKLEYEIGETVHVTGMKLVLPEQPSTNPHPEIHIDRKTTIDQIGTTSTTGGKNKSIWYGCYFQSYVDMYGTHRCDEIPEMIQNDDGTYAIDILLTEDNAESGTYQYIHQHYHITYYDADDRRISNDSERIATPPFFIK